VSGKREKKRELVTAAGSSLAAEQDGFRQLQEGKGGKKKKKRTSDGLNFGRKENRTILENVGSSRKGGGKKKKLVVEAGGVRPTKCTEEKGRGGGKLQIAAGKQAGHPGIPSTTHQKISRGLY